MNKEAQINLLIKNALLEDIGDGDHSTLSTIETNERGKAVLKIKQEGILAGMEVAEKIFKFMEPEVEFFAQKKDGERMQFGRL
ncbi:MAG TPA: hypothetical protein VLR54_01610 [Methanobacteriaceae archaeon]|nr:hypothetical protein [Methanobacteriaceae archaeon]